MDISRVKWAALVLGTVFSACKTNHSGGQGIGFSPQSSQPGLARSEFLGLRLGRLYLPRDSQDGYVELVNTAAHPLEPHVLSLQLQSHAGRIDVSFSEQWPAGESRQVPASQLTPLCLHAQAGELVLLRDGSAIEAYGSWGAHPSDWPTGYGLLASRLGVDTQIAYPLPLVLHHDLAVDLSESGVDVPVCRRAMGERPADSLTCQADPSYVPPVIHLQVEGDGETIHLDWQSHDDEEDVDVFGMRLCTLEGCQTLMQDEPLPAKQASQPHAMHMTLAEHTAAFGARSSTPYVAEGDWIELVAPGDTPGSSQSRILGRLEPTETEEQ